ncbi:dipeptide epimerase [Virgibacillus sp. NKC19-3]|uniref:dipeptide epimerase n=1 Tax=Virgibacillus saliphilus TaxID=2831674 RepID=UPI001C9BB163|nr:dipeptide epimerase [Virgibacillus sp. NKC19-3]MBY7144082.1 dipeptide epimerase [Virgibacillus sp. NKC19-3]
MITDVTVTHTRNKLKEPFITAIRSVDEIETLTITVETDDGFYGVGAASPTLKITGDSLESIQSAVRGPIKQAIIGTPLKSLEHLVTKVRDACVGNTSAKAAVDIALYDLFSRKYQLPMYQLLGGYQREITTDMTLSIGEEAEMAAKAKSLVQQGFSALKVKLGGEFQEDLSRMRRLRQTVGESIQLRIDANQSWDAKTAVRFIRMLEEEQLDIEFIEQPVKAADFKGLAYVTNAVHTPIMADESLFSAADALRLVQMAACDLFNIKLMKTGGIREAIVIADIAEAAGIPCMIGSMMESPISVSAAVHLACGHRNIIYADMDAPLWLEKLEDTLVDGMISYNGPRISCLER